MHSKLIKTSVDSLTIWKEFFVFLTTHAEFPIEIHSLSIFKTFQTSNKEKLQNPQVYQLRKANDNRTLVFLKQEFAQNLPTQQLHIHSINSVPTCTIFF